VAEKQHRPIPGHPTFESIARQAGQNTQQAGFASTVGALNLNQLSRMDRERQSAEQLPTPTLQRQVVGRQ
jgi:hypothetical protein